MLTYGDYQIDETKLPEPIVQRLLTRAIAHVLGNECAASVLGKAKTAAGVTGKGPMTGAEKAQVDAWSEANATQIAQWEDEFRSAKIAAMLDGTLLVRTSRGPTRDPVEAAARGIAKAEMVAALKQAGVKFPTGDGTIEGPAAPDGNVPLYTADDLIDRRLSQHGERIRAAAAKKVRDAQRERDAIAKTVAGEGAGLAAALGL